MSSSSAASASAAAQPPQVDLPEKDPRFDLPFKSLADAKLFKKVPAEHLPKFRVLDHAILQWISVVKVFATNKNFLGSDNNSYSDQVLFITERCVYQTAMNADIIRCVAITDISTVYTNVVCKSEESNLAAAVTEKNKTRDGESTSFLLLRQARKPDEKFDLLLSAPHDEAAAIFQVLRTLYKYGSGGESLCVIGTAEASLVSSGRYSGPSWEQTVVPTRKALAKKVFDERVTATEELLKSQKRQTRKDLEANWLEEQERKKKSVSSADDALEKFLDGLGLGRLLCHLQTSGVLDLDSLRETAKQGKFKMKKIKDRAHVAKIVAKLEDMRYHAKILENSSSSSCSSSSCHRHYEQKEADDKGLILYFDETDDENED